MLKNGRNFLTTVLGNVQEWSDNVSNRLDGYLRNYDHLKSPKIYL